jgi:hypothetical protein
MPVAGCDEPVREQLPCGEAAERFGVGTQLYEPVVERVRGVHADALALAADGCDPLQRRVDLFRGCEPAGEASLGSAVWLTLS